MGNWQSSVIPPQVESFDQLLDKTVSALHAGDGHAERRRFRRLAVAVGRHDGIWRKMGVGDDAHLDEVRQSMLLKLWGLMKKWAAGAERPRNPTAYVWETAKNVAKDLRRKEARKGKWHMRADLDDPEVERSGVFTLEDLAEKADDQRVQERRMMQLRGHLQAYVAAAANTRVQEPERMLQAWFDARVLKRDATEIANELGETTATVWQWATRGARLIAKLAALDPDHERAKFMRAAAGVAAARA